MNKITCAPTKSGRIYVIIVILVVLVASVALIFFSYSRLHKDTSSNPVSYDESIVEKPQCSPSPTKNEDDNSNGQAPSKNKEDRPDTNHPKSDSATNSDLQEPAQPPPNNNGKSSSASEREVQNLDNKLQEAYKKWETAYLDYQSIVVDRKARQKEREKWQESQVPQRLLADSPTAGSMPDFSYIDDIMANPSANLRKYVDDPPYLKAMDKLEAAKQNLQEAANQYCCAVYGPQEGQRQAQIIVNKINYRMINDYANGAAEEEYNQALEDYNYYRRMEVEEEKQREADWRRQEDIENYHYYYP